ncbi:MAG: S8 family serine peptidase [Bacteroidota bacterium]
MILSPSFLAVALTVISLGFWFGRRNKRDANLWMYGTYAGLAFVTWLNYFAVGALAESIPTIIRDFILIGVVGLVQSMAVAKRISVVTALVLILGLFIVAYSIPLPAANGVQSTPTTSITTTSDQQTDYPQAAADGEYLVEKRPDVSEAQLKDWASIHGIKIRPAFTMDAEDATLLDEYYILDTKEASSTIQQLIIDSDLTTWVEMNEVITVDPLPAKVIPENKSVYGINDPAANQQWIMEALAMPEYYALLSQQKPKKVAKIAILDTGVDANHEDIKGNYFTTQRKYDNDPRGHGTHCAGIAAAVTNNKVGIASMAGPGKFVEVTSIKVLSGSGMGTQSTIIQGILEAADSGVDVISLSLGGISSQRRQRAYNQAISYARRNNAIVLAAAGNSNRQASGYSPANTAGIICVSAIDNLLLRAPFSNRVQGIKMPIAAPGVGIYSTIPGSKYATYSGTSMACPFVAGLIGVLRSLNPDLNADEMYDILQKTAQRSREVADVGPIVQPAAALQHVVSPQ